MTERPILFNAAMVRAILEGRKTVTRRPVTRLRHPRIRGPVTEFGRSDTPGYDWHLRDRDLRWHDLRTKDLLDCCPHGVPGDDLWGRETWQEFFEDEVPAARRGPMGRMGIPAQPSRRSCIAYRADGELGSDEHGPATWRPSIHMPRWASRIQLRVASVGVTRVSMIDDAEGIAEGFSCAAEFLKEWIDIYGPGVDWAWVVRFDLLQPAAGGEATP